VEGRVSRLGNVRVDTCRRTKALHCRAGASRIFAGRGEVTGARKITLFPGQRIESVFFLKRFWALFKTLRRYDLVAIGLSYREPEAIMLSWLLRFSRTRMVALSASKFDDARRGVWFEFWKSVILSPYRAAIVGAGRQIAYFRFLRFRRRPVLPGYNTVGLDRVRRQGGRMMAPAGIPFEQRPFVFIGRFVHKKNLFALIEGYARYVVDAGSNARRLILVGSGQLDEELRSRIELLGLAEKVEFPGFLRSDEVSQRLAGALALVLVSQEEQWGLVINEALAFGLPVIASTATGARDVLLRNLVNGYIVEPGSAEGIAQAMLRLAEARTGWERMVAASHERAWMADADRFADAVELLLEPGCEPASSRVSAFRAQMEQ
jgi:glycosyltransferase involved in cell wall biosynthesis